MSHTTKITATKITSISALRTAVAHLASTGIACSLTDGGKPRAFYSNQEGMGEADHVMTLEKSRYDIGFYKQADGSYEPRTDFWGGDVEKILGAPASDPQYKDQAKLGKLFAEYAVAATIEQARNNGKMVQRVDRADGVTQLVLTGY